ncbi:MAG: hypothetical protein HC767_04710 [Akkermansiaceae bacterium]|nr:hypothetical protein [Akkermansiaceae bacterium]
MWVLEESLRRIEQLLNLPEPAAFFNDMLAAGVLEKLPDMRPLMGPKKMLLDQAHVDDVLETSVHQRYSKRRSIAANIPYELGKQVWILALLHLVPWTGNGCIMIHEPVAESCCSTEWNETSSVST